LSEIAIEAADVDGLSISSEPVLYDWEKVCKELGFIDENGVGCAENLFIDIL
jgi:hypothetical protein